MMTSNTLLPAVEFPPAGEAYVYFVQAIPSGVVKVGRTYDIKKRVQSLQVGHHEPLRLVGWTWGGAILEKAILRAVEIDHVRGEWFNPHVDFRSYLERLPSSKRKAAS